MKLQKLNCTTLQLFMNVTEVGFLQNTDYIKHAVSTTHELID